jgi:hypothetical protein
MSDTIGPLQAARPREINAENGQIINSDSNSCRRKCKILNPNCRYIVGDRVMMTKNNYDIGLFNGDEGIVVDITLDSLVVEFKDNQRKRFRLYTKDEQYSYSEKQKEFSLSVNVLIHAFALTIHRSQGSENNYIIFYLPPNAKGSFITRNLIYTAITRPQCAIWIVGDLLKLREGICRPTPLRWDTLARRLVEKFPRFVSDPVEINFPQSNNISLKRKEVDLETQNINLACSNTNDENIDPKLLDKLLANIQDSSELNEYEY